jgi:hypothetical protein
MKQFVLPLFQLLSLGLLSAQDITFDQGNWHSQDLSHQRVQATIRANEERVDTVFTEDLRTGELEIHIETHPLARYEYHPWVDLYAPLWRRIDIRQEVKSDSTRLELSNGTTYYYRWTTVIDIPNGVYHEFFPNGNMRIKGTLDGYNPDGTLKKTGTWMEWDAEGNIIREEHYPPSPTRSSPSHALPPR